MHILVFRRRKHALPAMLALLLAAGLAIPALATTPPASTTAGSAGSSVAIGHWHIQSSANAPQGGHVISQPGYAVKGWYPVSAHVTVMAGLMENGKYPDVFYGVDMRKVQVPDTNHRHFQIPWWYRGTFKVEAGPQNLHTFIRLNGIIPRADVWLNGHKIAGHAQIAGAYTTHAIDVTGLVHAGDNVLAIRVHPASTQRDLVIGWVDWNPEPPDVNMGIWRNVDIVRSGPVSLHGLHVTSRLALPGLKTAWLTVKARVRNDSSSAEDVVISGTVAGVALRQSVHLAAHASREVTFDAANTPALKLVDPKVWWPIGMGAHPLYHASLKASVTGALSDTASTGFGIRSVTSHLTAQGYRQFVINGKPLLIRGAGWAPDMFLRDQPQRLADIFGYIRNLGLNTIRLEGKLERPDFYRLADRDGIMVLAGWECCDKWEAWAKTGGQPWDDADIRVAGQSMASEARRLRNHPSVIAFLIGSDNAPPANIAKVYVDALHQADWPNPIIAAASDQGTQLTGPSGLKMSGPYAWVPPSYWYADKAGGAFGFNSETSAGISIPRLSSLKKMLPPYMLDVLWKDPDTPLYHAAPLFSRFSSLKIFDTQLAERFGAPKNLLDYVKKAQLANYANTRAQFEAYSAHMDAKNPATGVIYWMLDSAWPDLHWHLFNYDLNPAGAYFGAQKANQPLHIQYAYDNRAIVAVNHTSTARHDLTATIRVHNLNGTVRYQKRIDHIDLPANRTTRVATLPALDKLSGTYFVELDLANARGRRVSRNVYWLSATPDQLDWAKSNWYTTPLSRHVDFKALQTLPQTTLQATAHTTIENGHGTTTVTLNVPRNARALGFFMHASLHGADGQPVLPITWSGNDVTLWPGQSITLTAHYRAKTGAYPAVQLDGWNIATQTIPASSTTH
ncbi:MAG TPA: glycoside hydrolase family 2 TIM barrel-domain containing protein [Rhodanobacteraceae bacterium]